MPTNPEPSSNARGWISWPGWLMAAVILVACWTPSRRLPVGEKVPHLPHADKLIHCAMFASYGVVASWRGGRRATLLLGLILAIGSELGQATPLVARDASVADASADLIGLLAGTGLARLATRR